MFFQWSKNCYVCALVFSVFDCLSLSFSFNAFSTDLKIVFFVLFLQLQIFLDT